MRRPRMSSDRKKFLTAMCLLAATLAGVNGEEPRISRSINPPTVRSSRLNTLHFEDRDRYQYSRPNYLTQRASRESSVDDESLRKIHDDEEQLFNVITSKDYRVSTPSEIANFDRIGDQMITRANLTEDAKRVVRQVKRQRPGLFWTLARVAFETVNETRSAIEQISALVLENIVPETTTVRGGTGRGLGAEGAATQPTTTTTTTTTTSEGPSSEEAEEEPFKLSPSELQTLIRRNVRGLVRLFNIEWRDALNQSQTTVQEFRKELSNRISPFLRDNPDVV
ncbi:uncharacterized protein [Venturia canescens]|uniref:uncharacterized protein isoform X2 n=1 Tax=Venturia canescens TaxID=32260 RepID=UPI001C9C3997|nr:uncharacterized protein LOC122417665 isoform X2 [Venturia canescens]